MSAAPALDFSFEFFPPRTPQGRDKLRATWQQLAQLKPRFFSVTFGAGGSTREGTLDTVLEIRMAGHEAAPHISCVASTRADVARQLERYREHGIRHIVALRGDLPSGIAASGEFRYASELVAFIRETTADWFQIEVACYPEYHPQTRNADDEIRNFKRKVDAGADGARALAVATGGRRADSVDQRVAHRLLVSALLTAAGILLVLDVVPIALQGSPLVAREVLALVLVPVVLACWVAAVLGYRLVEIDATLRRSLIQLVLAALVGAVFLAAAWAHFATKDITS